MLTAAALRRERRSIAHVQGWRLASAGGGLDTFPQMTPPDDDTETTLFEWAGGVPAIRRMIDAFYDRVERNDLFDELFPGGVTEEHRDHVTTWWSEVFGGPTGYTSELGGYERML